MKRDTAALIEETVRSRFPGIEITEVRVSEDSDFDGDTILRVTVIHDHKGLLDPEKTVSIVRHIRHRLLAIGETAFPITAFVSKADAAGLNAEAA